MFLKSIQLKDFYRAQLKHTTLLVFLQMWHHRPKPVLSRFFDILSVIYP